jgi:hypothetical protein
MKEQTEWLSHLQDDLIEFEFDIGDVFISTPIESMQILQSFDKARRIGAIIMDSTRIALNYDDFHWICNHHA